MRNLQFNMMKRPRRARRARRAATVLEMSIILMLFLVVTMGMLDLGVGVYRYHILSQAARHCTRRAIVHGEMANRLGPWGPGTINVMASSSGVPILDDPNEGVKPMLINCDLSQTQILVEWLNGSNELEEPVRASLSSPYTPIMLYIFPNGTITLRASSTMQIAH